MCWMYSRVCGGGTVGMGCIPWLHEVGGRSKAPPTASNHPPPLLTHPRATHLALIPQEKDCAQQFLLPFRQVAVGAADGQTGNSEVLDGMVEGQRGRPACLAAMLLVLVGAQQSLGGQRRQPPPLGLTPAFVRGSASPRT